MKSGVSRRERPFQRESLPQQSRINNGFIPQTRSKPEVCWQNPLSCYGWLFPGRRDEDGLCKPPRPEKSDGTKQQVSNHHFFGPKKLLSIRLDVCPSLGSVGEFVFQKIVYKTNVSSSRSSKFNIRMLESVVTWTQWRCRCLNGCGRRRYLFCPQLRHFPSPCTVVGRYMETRHMFSGAFLIFVRTTYPYPQVGVQTVRAVTSLSSILKWG